MKTGQSPEGFDGTFKQNTRKYVHIPNTPFCLVTTTNFTVFTRFFYVIDQHKLVFICNWKKKMHILFFF